MLVKCNNSTLSFIIINAASLSTLKQIISHCHEQHRDDDDYAIHPIGRVIGEKQEIFATDVRRSLCIPRADRTTNKRQSTTQLDNELQLRITQTLRVPLSPQILSIYPPRHYITICRFKLTCLVVMLAVNGTTIPRNTLNNLRR